MGYYHEIKEADSLSELENYVISGMIESNACLTNSSLLAALAYVGNDMPPEHIDHASVSFMDPSQIDAFLEDVSEAMENANILISNGELENYTGGIVDTCSRWLLAQKVVAQVSSDLFVKLSSDEAVMSDVVKTYELRIDNVQSEMEP